MSKTRFVHQPKLNKRRSRRLRKKLHLGEFQRLGFGYELSWSTPPSTKDQEAFIESFLGQVVEPRGLCLGGGCTVGFLEGRRENPSALDRDAVQAWLQAWPGVERVEVGPLQDAWYDEA